MLCGARAPLNPTVAQARRRTRRWALYCAVSYPGGIHSYIDHDYGLYHGLAAKARLLLWLGEPFKIPRTDNQCEDKSMPAGQCDQRDTVVKTEINFFTRLWAPARPANTSAGNDPGPASGGAHNLPLAQPHLDVKTETRFFTRLSAPARPCNQVLARGQHSARRNPHTVHCSKSFLRLLKTANVYMYDKTPFVTRSRS